MARSRKRFIVGAVAVLVLGGVTALVVAARSSTSHAVRVAAVPSDTSGPHLGDGICAPSTNPVYAGRPNNSSYIKAGDLGPETVEAADPTDVPHMTQQQAIDAARSLMLPLPPT